MSGRGRPPRPPPRGAAGLTRRRLLAAGGVAVAGVALGGGQARARETLSAAPLETVGLAFGKTVSRVDVEAPGAPAAVFRPSRAGLDGDRAAAHFYRVDRLDDDDAPGTLRHALTPGPVHDPGAASHGRMLDGPRIVVFDAGGVIPLRGRLHVDRPRTWVAGQTAPAPVILHGYTLETHASEVTLQHLTVVHGKPAGARESEVARAFLVSSRRAGPAIANVWIDHCTGFGACDEAATTWPGAPGRRVDNVVFSHCVFGLPQQSDAGAPPYHEPDHAMGLLIGPMTSGAVIECGIFGMLARSPQIARGGSKLFANFYASDFWNWAGPRDVAPLLVNVNINPGHAAHLDSALPESARGCDLTVVGSYAEPGWFTYSRLGEIKKVSGRILMIPDARGPHRFYDDGNFVEPAAPAADPARGPDGESAPLPPGVARRPADAPVLWSALAPTHGSAIRARVLAHGGAWPSARGPLVAGYLARVAAQAGRSWAAGEREPLHLVETAPSLPPAAAARGAWEPPDAPFALRPDGLTVVEAALHALTVARGGSSFGNLDRPLYAPGGGALVVTAAGAARWTGARAAHAPLTARVTFADGDEARVALVTA